MKAKTPGRSLSADVPLVVPPLARLSQPDALIGGLLFVGALLLRLYRIAANPLWLDEIYGYQLGQLGLRAILVNSGYDQHPPLYYLLQWAGAGFGTLHSAWALRWLSALSGALTVPLVYRFARAQGVGWLAALLAGTLLAVSPMTLYFSQEARSPALVMLLSALSLHMLWRVCQHPEQRRAWIRYVLVLALGLYTSFSFVFVVVSQLCYTLFVLRAWRKSLLAAGALALVFAPVLFVAWQPLTSLSKKLADSGAVTLLELSESLLGGDIVRYGQEWTHVALVAALGALAAAGIGWGWRSGDRRTTLARAIQVVLPLVGFFVAAPLVGVRLPAYESKQFIVLLPAFFVLVAQGVQALLGASNVAVPRSAQVWRLLGACGAAALLCVALAASAINIQRYWATPKSPEGSAVIAVRAQMQPGDAVVSAHYSLDAALSFYLPDAPHFTKPRRVDDQYQFAQSLLVLPFVPVEQTRTPSSAIVGQYPRVWLLALAARDAELVQTFGRACATSTQQRFGPFRATLFTGCQRR